MNPVWLLAQVSLPRRGSVEGLDSSRLSAAYSRGSAINLVCLVYFVGLVCLVDLVRLLIRPKKPEQPDQLIQPERPEIQG